MPCRTGWVLIERANQVGAAPGTRRWQRHTVCSDHLLSGAGAERRAHVRQRVCGRTFTSGSLFMTFLILASGSGGWR